MKITRKVTSFLAALFINLAITTATLSSARAASLYICDATDRFVVVVRADQSDLPLQASAERPYPLPVNVQNIHHISAANAHAEPVGPRYAVQQGSTFSIRNNQTVSGNACIRQPTPVRIGGWKGRPVGCLLIGGLQTCLQH
jgi:hypothetical protein